VPLSSGIASISGSGLVPAPGAHVIAAIYSGDPYYQSSLSASQSFTVNAGDRTSTTSITVAPSTVAQGASVTVTASIAPATPVPLGTVQLMLDGNLYGSSVSITGAATNLPLLTGTLQPGAHFLSIVYSGDGNHQAGASAAATLTILESAGAFTLSPAIASTSALLGKTSNSVTLTATPSGGFQSTVTFACTGGLPSGAVCHFAPSSINLNGSNSQTTILTIAAAASTLAARTPDVPHSRHLPSGVGIALAGVLFFLLPGPSFLSRRTRRLRLLTLLLTLSTVGILSVSGCGRGGVDPNGLTPGALSAGSYAVTVTATGGSTIQTATINLTLQ
jgi:hypothetical protein